MNQLNSMLGFLPFVLYNAYEDAGRIVSGTQITSVLDLTGNERHMVAVETSTPTVDVAEYPTTKDDGVAQLPDTRFNLASLIYDAGASIGSVGSYSMLSWGPADWPGNRTEFRLLTGPPGTGQADSLAWGSAGGGVAHRQIFNYTSPPAGIGGATIAQTATVVPTTGVDNTTWRIQGVRRIFVGGVSTWRAWILYDVGAGCEIQYIDQVESASVEAPTLRGFRSDPTGVVGGAAYFDRALSDLEMARMIYLAASYISVEAAGCVAGLLGVPDQFALLEAHKATVFAQLNKHVEAERAEAAAPYFQAKACQLALVRFASDQAILHTSRLGSAGRWLDLYMEGVGISRSSGETDLQLQARGVQFARGVVDSDLVDIVNEVLPAGTGATHYEWWERGPALGVLDAWHGFVLGRSRLFPMGGFLIFVPDLPENEAVQDIIISRINAAKKSGARWFLVFGEFYPTGIPATYRVLAQGGDTAITQASDPVIHQG